MSWIKIFDSITTAREAIPNQTSKLVKIGDARICLINSGGHFYAMDNRCPHMGASLSEGIVNYLGEVICPLHEYRFHPKTGDESNQKCRAATIKRVDVNEKGLFVEV